MTAEIAGVDVVHDGWAKFLIARVRLADGMIVRREIEDHGRAACVLPYDPVRGTAMLVRVLRAPALYAAERASVLEAIAGLIEHDDADAMAGARREAYEEAGLRL